MAQRGEGPRRPHRRQTERRAGRRHRLCPPLPPSRTLGVNGRGRPGRAVIGGGRDGLQDPELRAQGGGLRGAHGGDRPVWWLREDRALGLAGGAQADGPPGEAAAGQWTGLRASAASWAACGELSQACWRPSLTRGAQGPTEPFVHGHRDVPQHSPLILCCVPLLVHGPPPRTPRSGARFSRPAPGLARSALGLSSGLRPAATHAASCCGRPLLGLGGLR